MPPFHSPFIFFQMIYFIIAAALIALTLVIRNANRLQKERDAAAARQTYEHIACPILVSSDFPDDPTVNMRAFAWREKLRAAGNKYSETLPIVAYPYALGASPELGILTTWRQYRQNCLLKEKQLFEEWEQEQIRKNQNLFEQAIAGQRPALNTL
jgi:hypothetical protein